MDVFHNISFFMRVQTQQKRYRSFEKSIEAFISEQWNMSYSSNWFEYEGHYISKKSITLRWGK